MSDTPHRPVTYRHPLAAPLVRYRAVYQAAWRQRHELAGPGRMADEAAFLPAALSNSLAKQGYVSRHDDQDRIQARIEMEHDLATVRAGQAETAVTIEQAKQALAAWQADTLKTLNERHAKADLQQRQLQAEDVKASQRVRLTTLTAPVDGTVQQLAVHTTGGVVTPAQVLLVVVPEKGQVMADVILENKDVGFVNVGQPAEIKLETFPATRYGTVPGKVATITADAVMQDPKAQSSGGGPEDKPASPVGGAVFPATLTLAQNIIDVGGKQIRLTPGMNLTAEIKTGRRVSLIICSVRFRPMRGKACGSGN